MHRRAFLRRLGGAAALPSASLPGTIQEPKQAPASRAPAPGGGAVGTLRDPSALGRPWTRTDAYENELAIQQVEQRLVCPCGCNHTIFTCRTTHFSCTYAPALHREVVALWTEGKRGQQIVDAFVAKYGEKALMSPKPEGFNLAGYFVPGAVVLAAGGTLLAVLLRRRATVAAAAVTMAAAAGSASVPLSLSATPDELERLRRALAEVDD